jgi:Tol biopolymer transport system component
VFPDAQKCDDVDHNLLYKSEAHMKTIGNTTLLVLTIALVSCSSLVPNPKETPTPIETSLPTSTSTPQPTKTPVPTLTSTPVPIGAIIAYSHIEAGGNSLNTIDIDYGTQTKLSPVNHDVTFFSWSPDGQQLVYQASNGTNNEIYTVSWNGLSEPQILLSDSADGNYPVWSPDGKKIAFFSRRLGHWALFAMNVDGTGQKALTDNTVFGSVASWSQDSTKIVFNPWHNTEAPPFIAAVNTDGSNYIELTKGRNDDNNPVWSPTGDTILFSSWKSGRLQIYSIKSDGSGLVQLTKSSGGNDSPVWSPDGTKIAFVSWRDSKYPNDCEGGDCNFEIYVMNADGSNQTRITDNPAEDWAPAWSPDGTKIAFQSLRNEPAHPKDCGDKCNSEIYVMNVNGSDVMRITENETPDFNISWRPISK